MTGVGSVCPVTGEPLAPGETIGRGAAARLRALVSDLPELMGDAAYALSVHRRGGGGGAVRDSRPLVDLSLLAEVDDMRDAVDAWVAAVREWACPAVVYRPGDWVAARAVLTQYADRLRRWEHAPQLLDELAYALRRIEYLTSPAREVRRYVGPCPECGVDVMVRPDAAEAECPACGARFDVDEARAVLHERLLEMHLPRESARRAAEVVAHRPIKADTVKKWVQRGLVVERVRPNGPPTVRVGDIVARVLELERRQSSLRGRTLREIDPHHLAR